MIFSDGKSLQKKTIAVKGIVFYVKYFAITYPILATLAILAHLLNGTSATISSMAYSVRQSWDIQ